ncbi:MAG: DUF3048 domain-containing protein, partial [Bacillota bacterium]|nr:DUF3048 domain-containing protein [Bacillota bacterium]
VKEIEEIEEIEEVEEIEKFYSVLTGEEIEAGKINNRAFAVMLDNFYTARPQAGLSQADIVYEILAEGPITRYMAVFQSEYPTNIGPVRSARPYFVKKSLEFNAFYTHVGGSPQGLIDIKRLNSYDIDAMSCRANTFFRVDYKKIPHNMYTSSDKILKEAERKKYEVSEEIDFFDFYKEDTMINGDKGSIIKIAYKKPTVNDSVGYVSEYRYDNESSLYYRYTNSKKYIDENNNEEITTKNILIQYAKTRVIDNVGRRKIDIVGKGNGLYFTNGEYIKITWEKLSESGRTLFYNESLEEIKLNKGKTWIQVVPQTLNVEIE